jgi:2-oxoglutarate ferredoxin oxidoreductase subunit beta
MHLMRRNVNVNYLLFNNRIYGLTKGQYSPTSETGKKTKSTPYGSLEEPVNPVSLALAAKAGFVGRALAVDAKGLAAVLQEAHAHKGTSIIEIFQNCNVFNNGAFDAFAERKFRASRQVQLTHGEELSYGEENENVLVLDGLTLHAKARTDLKDGETPLMYDRHNRSMATLLGDLPFPEYPVPMGVLYQEERPSYEAMVHTQVEDVIKSRGAGDLQKMLRGSDSWKVAS